MLVRRIGFPQDLLVDGEKPKVEFPDAKTVRYSWSKPNPRFLPWLAAARRSCLPARTICKQLSR